MTDRGAVVDGALHFPTAAESTASHVMVMYKGDAGYMTDQERATLDAFVKRGGGHRQLPRFALRAGHHLHGQHRRRGEKARRGEFLAGRAEIHHRGQDASDHGGNVGVHHYRRSLHEDDLGAVRRAHPGDGSHACRRQARAKWFPRSGPTSTPCPAVNPARAFVWMQGHTYTNFADPRVQPMILRGIAWAAKKPIDALKDVVNTGRS